MSDEPPSKRIKLEGNCDKDNSRSPVNSLSKDDFKTTTSSSSSSSPQHEPVRSILNPHRRLSKDNDEEEKENKETITATEIETSSTATLINDLISSDQSLINDISLLLTDEDDDDTDNDHHHLTEMQIFIMGFRSCGREAIRYLIEDEGLNPDDPIVISLQDHLKMKEKLYIMQCFAAAAASAASSRGLTSSSSSSSVYQSSSSHRHQLDTTFTSIDSDYGSTSEMLTITTNSHLESTLIDHNSDKIDQHQHSSSLELSPCPSESSTKQEN